MANLKLTLTFVILFHFSHQLNLNLENVKRLTDIFDNIAKNEIKSYPEEFWPHFASFGHFSRLLKDTNKISDRNKPKDIEDTVICEACGALLDAIINAVNAGTPVEEIEDSVIRLCTVLGIEDEVVCDGYVHVFSPYVEFMIREVLGDKATSELFCGVFFKAECLGEELENEVNGWTVELPDTIKPPFAPPGPPAEGSATVKVLLFTDVHVDLTYLPGSPVECGLPCCCMNSTGLAIGDQTPAPYWGTYAGCDMPLHTLEEMFRQISTDFADEFSYALFAGDAPAHDNWAQTKESNLAHTVAVLDLFKEYFPDLKLYVTLGNHEGFPVNVFPPREITHPDFDSKWLYETLIDEIGEFLSVEAIEQFRLSGSYSVRPFPGLKIVNVNSNYGSRQNVAIFNDFVDPDGCLTWLIAELQGAEDNGELVHILMHHPSRGLLRGWKEAFTKIVVRYENTVRAILVGNEHTDEQMILIGEGNVPTVVTYINPSFTSKDDRAPEFRIFTFDGGYDGASWQVLDMDTYFADIAAFTDPSEPPVYELLYNAREAFGMSGMQASDWMDVMNRAVTDDALYNDIVRFHEQNWAWELPNNRTEYLCGKLYNSDECLLDNLP